MLPLLKCLRDCNISFPSQQSGASI